jgi:hypothetical protein
MSFNQSSPEDTSGVVVDSFFAISPLQHMSRRHIMSRSVKVAEIVGLAPGGLFGTLAADRIVLNQEKNVGGTPQLLYLEEWHCSIIECPEHYKSFCGYSDLLVGAIA